MAGKNRQSSVLQDSPPLKHMCPCHRKSLDTNVTDGHSNHSTAVHVPNLQRVHSNLSGEKHDVQLERTHMQCCQEPSYRFSHSRDKMQCCRAGFSQRRYSSRVSQSESMRQTLADTCRSTFTTRYIVLVLAVSICLILPSCNAQAVSSELHRAAIGAPNEPSFPHIESWNSGALKHVEMKPVEQSHSTLSKMEIPDLITEVGRLFYYQLPVETSNIVKVSLQHIVEI